MVTIVNPVFQQNACIMNGLAIDQLRFENAKFTAYGKIRHFFTKIRHFFTFFSLDFFVFFS